LRNSRIAKTRPIKVNQGHSSWPKLYFHCTESALNNP
jgi:hypothetical protein